ncbi:hypothetical protein ACLB2K_027127 [Fragaria x ananassa]
MKLLSNIDDQQCLKFHVPFIMSYKNNHSTLLKPNDPVEVIRDALSKALQLREGPHKKLLVDLTGEGILFIEANAEVTLDELGDAILPPCPFLEEFMFNVPGSDAILVGEIARGKDAPSTSPVWERELLSARDPPRISCTHKEFDDSIDHSYLKYGATVQQSYCFGPNKEIKALRELLPPHLSTCSSTFELITACVWKCRTLSLDMDPEQIVRLSCIITALGKHNNVCLPLGYYGNTFTYPAVVSTAERLCNSPLGYAVELVKKSKAKMSEEYFRSTIDFVEVRGRPPLAMEGMSDFIVSDNTRTGLGEIDFGLGKPVYAGVAESIDLISFYVRSTNKEERYEILVPICLPLLSMEMFQQELKKMIGSDKVETPSHIKL